MEPVTSDETLCDTVSIDRRTIYRNRTNNGVNLGSFFVLESWIYDNIFNDVGGASCEFDAVTKCVARFGVDTTAQKLKAHYEDYLSKINWGFLRNNANITSVRVPIGYWHVNNGSFLNGMPFAPLMSTYNKARPWDYLKRLIQTAAQHNISVLIDMHGLPGAANSEAHSGMIYNPPVFFKTAIFVNKMCDEILPFIVRDVCLPNENIAGLQIVNEAAFANTGNEEKAYYSRAVRSISKVDNNLPVIISDGWWPQQFSDWVSQNKLTSTVVIDSHIYRCFSNEDKGKDAQTIINQLSSSVSLDNSKADFLVGEFSCVLDEETWRKTNGDRNQLIKSFGRTQTQRFYDVASFGWYFWTLQFKWGDGGEWGFVPQVSKNNLQIRPKNAQTIDQNKVNRIIVDHINYWKGKGDRFEHWRYEDGIRQAVQDIQEFNNFENSRLGRWTSWTLRRRNQYIASKGDSSFMWEWDQAYKRGLDEFNK